MKTPNITANLVLIQPDPHFDKVGELVVNDVFDPAYHFSVEGEVLAVPSKLRFFGREIKAIEEKGRMSSVEIRTMQKLSADSLEFDTDMQLQVGDRVVFRYINHVGCMEDGMYLDLGKKRKALFIDYDSLFMGIRPNGDRVMLNGFMFIEPIEWTKAELDMGGMIAVKDDDKKPGVGIVRELGIPNRGYRDTKVVDDDSVKVGDKVYFRKTAGVLTEYRYHEQLNEGKHQHYRIQRKDILYVEPN